MQIILWVCFYIILTVGVLILLGAGCAVAYWAIWCWWPEKIRSPKDEANLVQINRIGASLYRVGQIGCEAHSIEQLCWFCQQNGIQLRETEHGLKYTQAKE